MIYNATNLISEAFDNHDVKYTITERDNASIVEARFQIDMGPVASVLFISTDETNAISMRVNNIVNNISANRRVDVLEAINKINNHVRFIKFCLDEDNDINVEADLLRNICDNCIGEACYELLVITVKLLDSEFHVIGEALYSNHHSNHGHITELVKAIRHLQEEPIVIAEDEEDENEEESDEDFFESLA